MPGAWPPEGGAEGRGDLAGLDAVFDPELADPFVVRAQGETVGGKGMGEEGGVEVKTEAVFLRPVDPGGEVLRADLVPRDFLSARVQVDGVEGEFLLSGDEDRFSHESKKYLLSDEEMAKLQSKVFNLTYEGRSKEFSERLDRLKADNSESDAYNDELLNIIKGAEEEYRKICRL